MAKKIMDAKRSIKSGFNFSKFYFSKPTSVALVTTYAATLVLVLSVLGLSKIIAPRATDEESIPHLPESEAFTFLPADNIEVPTLGDTDQTKPKEDASKNQAETKKSESTTANSYSSPAPTAQPVVVEVPKEVVKTVEKEVTKTITVEEEVVKEVVKEVPVEIPVEPEQTYLENYYAPEANPIGNIRTYENFPDIEEPIKSPEETPPNETQKTEILETEESNEPSGEEVEEQSTTD